MSEKIATREAYGKALVELGEQNKNVVVLDADLPEAVGRTILNLAIKHGARPGRGGGSQKV